MLPFAPDELLYILQATIAALGHARDYIWCLVNPENRRSEQNSAGCQPWFARRALIAHPFCCYCYLYYMPFGHGIDYGLSVT